MPRVTHFEFAADQPERAVKFYTEVFGWKVNKWEGGQDYWLLMTGEQGTPGIDGAIMRPMGPQRVVNTIDVPSVDEFVAKIEAGGGKVVEGKMAVPGIGYMAYCLDTEGNMFGLMQFDPSAK